MVEEQKRILQDYERLKLENKKLQLENEKLRLQLQELREMKYGRKRDKTQLQKKPSPKTGLRKSKEKRPPESYRRQEPTEDEITDELKLEIDVCDVCGSKLEDAKEYIHYREDICDIENRIKSLKMVLKVIVESGYCPKCKTRKFAADIPKQKTVIGQNIRSMIVYMSIIQDLSYKQILEGLNNQYGIKVSSGEVANILETESNILTPYYNNLVERMEEEPAHYDETSWKTGEKGKEASKGNYCWTKVSVKNNDRLFWFGECRGKGVAEELRGEKDGSIGISDNYNSYKNLFDKHQLCWAHPHRKLRDLAESDVINDKKRKKACKEAYKQFKKLYEQCREFRDKLNSSPPPESEINKRKKELMKVFDSITKPTENDPEKLEAIKKSLARDKDKYFTFFNVPILPLDNNKAERALRKLVIKRKKSFGSQSQKGANMLSVLYSVILTLMESNPDKDFFTLYEDAISYEEIQN